MHLRQVRTAPCIKTCYWSFGEGSIYYIFKLSFQSFLGSIKLHRFIKVSVVWYWLFSTLCETKTLATTWEILLFSLWLYLFCHRDSSGQAVMKEWRNPQVSLAKPNDKCSSGSQPMIKFCLGLFPSHMMPSLLLPKSLYFSLASKKNPVLLQLPAVGDMLGDQKNRENLGWGKW